MLTVLTALSIPRGVQGCAGRPSLSTSWRERSPPASKRREHVLVLHRLPELLRMCGHQIGKREQLPRQEAAAMVVLDRRVYAKHLERVSLPILIAVPPQVELAGHAQPGRYPRVGLADLRRREMPVTAPDDH